MRLRSITSASHVRSARFSEDCTRDKGRTWLAVEKDVMLVDEMDAWKVVEKVAYSDDLSVVLWVVVKDDLRADEKVD